MQRRTVIVNGPLAFRMRRLAAVRDADAGLQLMTLPLLAARLAGGFIRPAGRRQLEPAIRSAMAAGGFAELESMLALPGMTRALLSTLGKVWDADLDLQVHAARGSRLADLALIEQRVHAMLSAGALTPRQLRDRAIERLSYARVALGAVELKGFVQVAPVWQPLIAGLAHNTELSWRAPPEGRQRWFNGTITEVDREASATPALVSCADPHADRCGLRAHLLTSARRALDRLVIRCTATLFPETQPPQFLGHKGLRWAASPASRA